MSTSTPRRSPRRAILPSPSPPPQSLGCSRGTVRRVIALYKRADRNKDGTVDLEEFARTFDVERGNPFLPRLVALFDLSGDGEMGVFEFVVCLSQFRETGTGVRGQFDEHVYFAWRLFDTDDDGAMTKEEFKRVMGATYFRGEADRVVGSGADRKGRGLANFGGVGGMAKGLDNIMREVDVDGDGQVTIREFSRMLRKYTHIMAPAFDLWDKMSELSQPCAAMYREIKAAGNVQKLIDLAMMQSEDRAAKGGRFEDMGPRSDPNASSPPGMSVFRAHKERSDREKLALDRRPDANGRDTKRHAGGRFDLDTHDGDGSGPLGGHLDRRRAPRPVPPPRVETAPRRAATTTTERDEFGRSPPTPPPPKTADELEMERMFAEFDADEDEEAENLNRRGGGGRREYEPAVRGARERRDARGHRDSPAGGRGYYE